MKNNKIQSIGDDAEFLALLPDDVAGYRLKEIIAYIDSRSPVAAEPTEAQMDAAIDAYDKAWNPANRGRGNKEDALLAAFRALSAAAPSADAKGEGDA